MSTDNTVSKDEYDVLVASSLTEKAFQSQVRQHLEAGRWMVFVIPNMRMTAPGWPDLFAMHPAKPGRMLAWELKASTGVLSESQLLVLGLLGNIQGIDARVLRPQDWPDVRDSMVDGSLWNHEKRWSGDREKIRKDNPSGPSRKRRAPKQGSVEISMRLRRGRKQEG